MNEHEKYLFDLKGYLIVRNALTPEQVHDLSERLEHRREERRVATSKLPDEEKHHGKKGSRVGVEYHMGSDRTILGSSGTAWSSPSMLEWGGAYIDLIHLPTIAPYLDILLGKDYRLDHDYINIVNAKNPRQLYLHGGGQGAGGPTDLVGPTDGGQCYYRYSNGRFFNGLVAVAFELSDVNPGDGGFACVPGSHKVNVELPSDWKLSKPQSDIPDCVDQVAVNAGDAIIFTEACAHGTVPWQGAGERRTIFYKYCPHAVAWSPGYYNEDHYEGLNETQRGMLMPPSAFGPNEHTTALWEKAREEQAELQSLRQEVEMLRQQIS